MCSSQCVLALLALYVGLAHSFSWDIVLARTHELEFMTTNPNVLTNSAKPSTSYYINWVTYDPVHNRVLYSEQGDSNIFVHSYDIATQKTETYSKRTPEHALDNLAYDPISESLFGTQKNSIYSFLLKPGSGSNNEVNGLKVFLADTKWIRDVGVNGYERYIYWITDDYQIERARFNSAVRELVVIGGNNVIRQCLTIDKQNIFWIEHRKGIGYEFFVQRADLEGNDITILYNRKEIDDLPEMMAASKDFIYWGNKYEVIFWQLPKNSSGEFSKATEIQIPWHIQGIACNDKIEEKYLSNQNDSAAASQLCLHGTTVSGKSVCDCEQGYTGERCEVSVCHNYCFRGDCSVSAEGQPKCRCNAGYSGDRCEATQFCGHGTTVSGKSVCECEQGYTGERCEVSVCHNYCVRGDCSVSAEGQPKCRCNAGYSGDRCEANACHAYCLNSGVCSLNEDGEPVCQCAGDYQGDRCDVPVFLIKCVQTVTTLRGILKTDVTSVSLGKGVKPTCASTVV